MKATFDDDEEVVDVADLGRIFQEASQGTLATSRGGGGGTIFGLDGRDGASYGSHGSRC